MRPRIYIAGPITGKPNFNRPAFSIVAERLAQDGFEPVNPHDLDHNTGATWEEYMRKDLAALLTCQEIVMLPGWERSKGASIEHDLAKVLGMRVSYI